MKSFFPPSPTTRRFFTSLSEAFPISERIWSAHCTDRLRRTLANLNEKLFAYISSAFCSSVFVWSTLSTALSRYCRRSLYSWNSGFARIVSISSFLSALEKIKIKQNVLSRISLRIFSEFVAVAFCVPGYSQSKMTRSERKNPSLIALM